MKRLPHRSLLGLMVVAASCGDPSQHLTRPSLNASQEKGGIPHGAAVAARDALLAGNAQMVLAAPLLVPPGAPLAPFVEASELLKSQITQFTELAKEDPRLYRQRIDTLIEDLEEAFQALYGKHVMRDVT